MKAKKKYDKGGITPRPEIGKWLMSQPKKVNDHYIKVFDSAYKRGANAYDATTTAYKAAKEFSLKPEAKKKSVSAKKLGGFPRPIDK